MNNKFIKVLSKIGFEPKLTGNHKCGMILLYGQIILTTQCKGVYNPSIEQVKKNLGRYGFGEKDYIAYNGDMPVHPSISYKKVCWCSKEFENSCQQNFDINIKRRANEK